MSVTLAGTFVGLFTIYIVLKNARSAETVLVKLFALNLLYEGFINVGYFITIGGQLFKVADFLQFVCVLISLPILIKKKPSVSVFVFIVIILTSVLLLIIAPYPELVRTFNGVDFINNKDYMHFPAFDLQTVKTSVRFICFVMNGAAVALCLNSITWGSILAKYIEMGRFIIGYAWAEFFIKNVLRLSFTQNIIQFVFGSDTSIMTGLVRNGLRVTIGFNNEPSQFCMMLYSYFIIYIISKAYLNQKKRQMVFTLSGLLLMLLCGSFRAITFLPIILLLYLVISDKPANKIAIMIVFSVGMIVLYVVGAFDYNLVRLSRALEFIETLDTSIAGGEAGRINTIIEAISVFIKRPLLGIGPGQTFAYGFIPSMLAMTGLLGLLSWYNAIFGSIGRVRESVNKNKWILILVVISISWIYNDSIGIGYSIYVLAIAFIIRFDEQIAEYSPA